MSVDEWKLEMTGVRRMIGQFANVPPCEVKGQRAPFLQGGGDTMFQMMEENNFLYDSSWPTRQYGYIDAEYAMFPYTLDYKTKQVSYPTEISKPCLKSKFRTAPLILAPSVLILASGNSL